MTNATDLFAAIREQDHARIAALLDADVSVLEAFDPDAFDATPLNVAVGMGDLEVIDLLLAHGADIDRKSNWWAGGFGPIHAALEFRREDLAEALAERGARVDAHAAAGLGRLDQLKTEVAQRPECVRERGGDGRYPLHFARTREIAEYLVEHGAAVDARDLDHESTAAQYAARHRPDVARFLIERGASADPFMLAAIGDTHRLDALLFEEPDVIGWVIDPERFPVGDSRAAHIYRFTLGGHATPLHVAARCNQPESIRVLVRHGADPATRGDYDESTALHVAAWDGHVDVIETLLDLNAPIDIASGKTHENEPIGWAIVSGQPGAVRVLLAHHAPIHGHHRRQVEWGLEGRFHQWSPQPLSAWNEIAELLSGHT